MSSLARIRRCREMVALLTVVAGFDLGCSCQLTSNTVEVRTAQGGTPAAGNPIDCCGAVAAYVVTPKKTAVRVQIEVRGDLGDDPKDFRAFVTGPGCVQLATPPTMSATPDESSCAAAILERASVTLLGIPTDELMGVVVGVSSYRVHVVNVAAEKRNVHVVAADQDEKSCGLGGGLL